MTDKRLRLTVIAAAIMACSVAFVLSGCPLQTFTVSVQNSGGVGDAVLVGFYMVPASDTISDWGDNLLAGTAGLNPDDCTHLEGKEFSRSVVKWAIKMEFDTGSTIETMTYTQVPPPPAEGAGLTAYGFYSESSDVIGYTWGLTC